MRVVAQFACYAASLLLLASASAEQHDGSSEDIAVYSYPGGPSATSVAERCCSLRRQLHARWLGDEAVQPWKPRCRIVVHAIRASYVAVVGRGAGQTTGCSLIRFDGLRIVERRIDLLVDPDGELPALAHELTHVVLADRFGGRQPPLWADEGIAILSDREEKQVLHLRDCQLALRRGTALRVAEVACLERFTSDDEVAAFYGQSLSLVTYLVQQASPSQFVDFVQAAMDQGYDKALRQSYQIDSLVDLERQWREAVMSASETPNPSGPLRLVGRRRTSD